MGRKIATIGFFVIFTVLFLAPITAVHAAAACPSSNWICTSQGGCASPCIRVVTQQGSRNSDAICACQIPNTPESVPVGGVCQRDSDCAPPGHFCYGGLAQKPICNENPLHPTQTPTASPEEYNHCQYVTDTTQKGYCDDCTKKNGVWTAIGCVPIDPNNPNSLIAIILQLGLGLAGGIAFLLILFGGLQIMTSAGNPEQLNAGRELITSAIIGLILILFSIFLLQFIGVTIIGIPGFKPQ